MLWFFLVMFFAIYESGNTDFSRRVNESINEKGKLLLLVRRAHNLSLGTLVLVTII